MSYTVATPGGAKPKPATVSFASTLLYVAGGLILVSAALSLYAFLQLDMTGLVETPGVDEQTMATTTRVVGIVSMAFYVVLAVGFGVLGVLVGRGKNPARIVTWTLGGIGVICCGCSAASNALGGTMMANLEGVDQQTVNEINARTPGWLTATDVAVDVLIFLALLGAIILLMLPASNDYFRAEQQVWIPPTYPGQSYPGQFPPPSGPGTLPPPPGGPGTPPPPPSQQ